MGNAYAPSYYGCCLIRRHACYLTETTYPVSGYFFKMFSNLLPLSYIHSSKKVMCYKVHIWEKPISELVAFILLSCSCNYFKFWMNLVLMKCCVSSIIPATQVTMFLPWLGREEITLWRGGGDSLISMWMELITNANCNQKGISLPNWEIIAQLCW